MRENNVQEYLEDSSSFNIDEQVNKDSFLKNDKKQRLLEGGYKLFTEKGIKATSIQNIVDKANVAKGTFYLYFKDKYELRDVLIT